MPQRGHRPVGAAHGGGCRSSLCSAEVSDRHTWLIWSSRSTISARDTTGTSSAWSRVYEGQARVLAMSRPRHAEPRTPTQPELELDTCGHCGDGSLGLAFCAPGRVLFLVRRGCGDQRGVTAVAWWPFLPWVTV